VAWDMPPMILVRFAAEEDQAVTRECWRLTVNLWETVRRKCREVEEGWHAGRVSDEAYRQMCERFAAVEAVWGTVDKVVEMELEGV